jgi:hypothetical protein
MEELFEITGNNLEPSRTPVNKLDGLRGLDGGDGRVHVLRDDVAAIEQTDGHVLAGSGVALHHLPKNYIL